ncbi:3-chloro-4-hydroxyphenylacetate reductive dehalogenase precursor [mine drainage metagenome]|uniref:3-chloro-4-hydroxyphenylacetate reductive dehalogenase n=1 Tax=mine drainage metagenome TaxID=410659 RepID=A0A1J5S1T2_9ZZZZ
MLIHPRSKNRPFHFGPYPLETLPRDDGVLAREASSPPRPPPAQDPSANLLARAADRYREIFARFAAGEAAPARAPLPAALAPRVADIKGGAYFMDASQVGICRLPDSAWLTGAQEAGHDFAVVILVEHARLPEPDNLAHGWTRDAARAVADMRAAEIVAVLAGHIRCMGFAARGHVAGHATLDLEKLAVMAGLAVRAGSALENPYLGRRFSVAAVATDYELIPDRPLHADALGRRGLRYWWGINGAQSGRERQRQMQRGSHLSRYPMETVKRVARPTTLIVDPEVPRVPKRAAFFQRALHGDLGERTRQERTRFAFKTPLSYSLLQSIRALVPFQDGAVSATAASGFDDPAANARALKSLSYFLGADLTGICEIPPYAWYSHREDGTAIEPYHRYAVVMLIDQGYDTMEAASGDDWISGAQSMRGYLRGAEIAGIMAEFLRGHGYSARAQTNADSDVLQLPLVLWAGLGEMSRIGELVLNPFVGPRFKSVVLTTDLPLNVDQPIDFGLQYFCSHCLKCARECPCSAISFGDKVMFNGYEIWKPDVERCARYRVTNVKGAACGRCMKTCPINKVLDADGGWLTRAASWLGINAPRLKPLLVPIATWLDDRLGNGRRNPVKKWWFDHEWLDGRAVTPKDSNRRDIDRHRKPAQPGIAYYHADMMPPPDEPGPVAVDRKAALAAAALIETPGQARRRVAAGGAMPAHYRPTPPLGGTGESALEAAAGPYQ